ncbi:MAG: motility protein A, partial [Paeniglutamicibacter sp.]
LWGLVSANFIWLPIGSRLRRLSELEIDSMTLVLEGVMAIQGGSQPILLEEKLKAMVPPHLLGKEAAQAKGADTKALLDDFKEAA